MRYDKRGADPGLTILCGWNGGLQDSGSPGLLGGSPLRMIARRTVAAVGVRPGPSNSAQILDAFPQ